MMIKDKVKIIAGFCENLERLSDYGEKPALQNADIERKIP